MRANVVTVNSGWILQKIAERIVYHANNNNHEFKLSHMPLNNVDANLYIDVGNCYKGKTATLDIGWFTHVHADDINTVDKVCLSMDFIYHQTHRYLDMFTPIYSKDKMQVATLCEVPPMFSLKKPVIGVFQRGVYEGKGFNFLMSMCNNTTLQQFKFLFVGSGWDPVVNAFNQNGITCECVSGELHNDYPSLYDSIDYLLIPSLWEGGPMNIIEAKAKGLPIISSDVGWVGTEFQVEYLYPPNDEGALTAILEDIISPYKERRKCVMSYSYKEFIDRLVNLIKKLRGE